MLQHGKLKDVRIVTYRNGSPKGLAYVEYEDEVRDQHSVMSVAFLKMEPATFDLFVRHMLEAVRCELTVCSKSREWTILSHDDCFIQGEVIGFQVLLGSVHPRSTRSSWWSPPVLQRGSC